jgi:hypothetical protein
MTALTCEKVFTFAEFQEDHPEVFEKLNYCCGLTEYKFSDGHYSFTNGINAWRFDCLLTDKQWKALAQLCIRYHADISDVIRGFNFETESVTVVDGSHKSVYELPTNMKGWVKNVFFCITPDGSVHS